MGDDGAKALAARLPDSLTTLEYVAAAFPGGNGCCFLSYREGGGGLVFSPV